MFSTQGHNDEIRTHGPPARRVVEVYEIHVLRNVTFRNVTPSLISPNLRECSVQIFFFVVTFPFHVSPGRTLIVEDLGGLGFRV